MSKQIPERQQTLADLMEKAAVETGNSAVVAEDFAEKNVPENLTWQNVKDAFEYRDDIAAADLIYTGKLAARVMAADPAAETVTVKTTFHRDNITGTAWRQTENNAGPKAADPTAKKITIGASRLHIESKGIKGADIGRIKDANIALITAALNKPAE